MALAPSVSPSFHRQGLQAPQYNFVLSQIARLMLCLQNTSNYLPCSIVQSAFCSHMTEATFHDQITTETKRILQESSRNFAATRCTLVRREGSA